MSPGATFERVYRAIKEQLGSARFRPGEHLEPRLLSDELNASITPVRDALHRLVGEGLVEAPRSDGFRVPIVTEVALRHLYAWNKALLMLAAREAGRAPAAAPDGPAADGFHVTDATFARIAALSGNPEHLEAVKRLSDRLRPVRSVEPRIIGAPDAELEEMSALLARGQPQPLRRAIAAFHRRRERSAPGLVDALLRER